MNAAERMPEATDPDPTRPAARVDLYWIDAAVDSPVLGREWVFLRGTVQP